MLQALQQTVSCAVCAHLDDVACTECAEKHQLQQSLDLLLTALTGRGPVDDAQHWNDVIATLVHVCAADGAHIRASRLQEQWNEAQQGIVAPAVMLTKGETAFVYVS